jgi:hypothetical protein
MTVEMKAAREQRTAVEAIEELGGSFFYDYQVIDGCDYPVDGEPPSGPTCLRNLLGNDFFATVVGVYMSRKQTSDSDLELIGRLVQLKWLGIGGINISDVGLENLQRLKQLQAIGIYGTTHITDTGLESFRLLTKLQKVYLERTQVTPEGIQKLQRALPNCKITR